VFWVAAEAAPRALAEVRDAVARWQAGGLAVDPARVRTAAAVPEAEWRDAWKRYFRVSRLTRQFVVVPSWEHFVAGPDDVVIDLDPIGQVSAWARARFGASSRDAGACAPRGSCACA